MTDSDRIPTGCADLDLVVGEGLMARLGELAEAAAFADGEWFGSSRSAVLRRSR